MDQRRRLVIVTLSPRVAPGLFAPAAWQLFTTATQVCTAPHHPATPALTQAGIVVTPMPADARGLLDLVRERPAADPVVWLESPDGDPGLATALAAELLAGLAIDLEVVAGAWDLPGARLLDLVAVMDRLRSPGGCPWDARQTHESLVPYLLEEAYETIEALETGDRSHLQEELGDLLLQVVFHARIAAEHPGDAWTIDDVAGGIVDKLVRRHPHVFDPEVAASGGDLERDWDELKRAEKSRSSAVEGIPLTLPALALADKVIGRATRADVAPPLEPPFPAIDGLTQEEVGDLLLRLVAEAKEAGIDPESALRQAVRRYIEQVQALEA